MPDNYRDLIPGPLKFSFDDPVFGDRVCWYAIDQNPLFSNPRRLPSWRIRKIAGNPYIWGGRRFATFEGARLFVIDAIAEWRRTYGRDEEECRRVTSLEDYRSALLIEQALLESIPPRRFSIGARRYYFNDEVHAVDPVQ